MRITDAIRGEHASMRPLLRQFREETDASAKADPVLVKAKASALKTIIKAHATIEEPYLFRPMLDHPRVKQAVQAAKAAKATDAPGQAIERKIDKVVRHALKEHKEIDTLLDKAIETGDQRALNKATRLALGHFAEEERDVFPLAEKILGANRLAQLGAEWAAARGIRL